MRAIGLLSAGIAVLTATTLRAEEFRSSDVLPPDYPTVQAVNHMSQLLRERTGGRHSIKVTAQAAGGSEDYAIQQTKIGTLDMTRANVSAFNNIVPSTLVLSLPYVFRSTAHMRQVLGGAIGDEILSGMEADGFVGLCFYNTGARSMFTREKPVRNVADLAGQRMRVQQSAFWIALMQAMGARTIPMPLERIHISLKANLIDGAEVDLPTYHAYRLHEVTKFYSLTEHAITPGILVFSKRTWDRLPPKDQAIIRATAKESAAFMNKLWDEREATARKAVEAAGVTIVSDVDRKSFAEAMAPVTKKFITSPKQEDLLRRIQAIDVSCSGC